MSSSALRLMRGSALRSVGKSQANVIAQLASPPRKASWAGRVYVCRHVNDFANTKVHCLDKLLAAIFWQLMSSRTLPESSADYSTMLVRSRFDLPV